MNDPAARVTRAVAAFDPMPSRRAATRLTVEVASSLPPGTGSWGCRCWA